ncbi:hypothetical protein HYPSUDRAFT_57205 [Hypholoma sublateritium FD-334 SS-4]|uniref:RING-type domain-containing protein n=1 Tax=Hypholoma sublateritium (strain FD-334 SS-4) TaxID=945553 RepID=A0A0D2NNM0_HYPSF|nr:hypothetical protein HYPSUDRAFT_57205 [Hypholoma sublateritium FD-334 SS-4]
MPAARNTRAQRKEEVIIISSDDEPDPPTVPEFVSDFSRRQKIRERLAARKTRRKQRDELGERMAQVERENERLASIVNSFRDFLECPICLVNLEDPVAHRIVCGHIFCFACIALESEAQVSRTGSPASKDPFIYTCPTCRKDILKSTPFVPIHGVSSMIEAIPNKD